MIIDYYMAFVISHVISTRDTHIIPSPRAEGGGPTANMGRGLIWHVKWKMPYHNLFIIYTSMRLSSYLWELVVFRNHVQSMDINIRHLRFFTIYFIQNPIFSKKYFKAISGQIFMKFISRHAEFLEFYFLSDNNFCLHGFCFLLI